MCEYTSMASRVSPSTLPSAWSLPTDGRYTQLDLATCNLSKVPALSDGVGRLKPTADNHVPYVATFEIDETDALALEQEAARHHASGDDDDEDTADRESELLPSGADHCVSLRLNSNHISAVAAHTFQKLPELRALDLSLNHLERLDLSAGECPR